MPDVSIYRKVVGPAISKGEAAALRALSDLKVASLIETNYAVAAPDFLQVPASTSQGLAIEYIHCVSLNNPATLQLRLQRIPFVGMQPQHVTGVTLVRATGGRAGQGTLTYTAAGTLLAWQGPGADTAGAAQNVGAGGTFDLAGGTVGGVPIGQTLRVTVSAPGLPAGNASNVITILDVDELIPVALVPTGRSLWVPFKSPLFIDRNVLTTFEVNGLLAGNDYSIYASVFRWRPAY